MATPALELDGIDKSFGAIHANRGISIRFTRGSIHGLVGENGAGKTTLMRIVYGMQPPDAGTIAIDGKPATLDSPSAAIAAGIGMVHQHFMLIDRFTVLENILLGAETGFAIGKAMAAARVRLGELCRDYGLELNFDRRIRDLPVGERQSVEILKALYRGAGILILDEPTSVLTPQQADRLFAMLRRLRDGGTTVIFVSHKLKEIMALTDTVTVLRQGRVVGETATADTNPDALAAMMIGHPVDLGRIGGPAQPGEVLLEARGLVVEDGRGGRAVDAVDLTVRRGEIVGLAGLAGSGQAELFHALAGILTASGGTLAWKGSAMPLSGWTAATARALGIGYVPDEPRRFGLVGDFSATENLILGRQDQPPAAHRGLIDREAMTADCRAAMSDFDVRPPLPETRVGSMSGGNQQKLLLAREIRRDPDLLLLGEPTHGIDIGATAGIQARLAALRAQGKAILLATSDLDQIRALADRILVMSDGRIVGQLKPEEADDRRLGLMMGGVA
jgi:simple sugar transport system ATP-binding protein